MICDSRNLALYEELALRYRKLSVSVSLRSKALVNAVACSNWLFASQLATEIDGLCRELDTLTIQLEELEEF